jgi:two-component system response regulator RpaA
MGKPQILVIDDEETLVKSIERMLRKEYQVSIAYSGIQGLKIARRVKPDLVVLDILMPGMDGYDTCRELRKDPLLRSTPVLFLSALSSVDSKVTSFEAGADDYLVKPFDIRELLLRIKAILRRSQQPETQAPSKFIKHGDITLNSQSFEVSTRKGMTHLTPIEFDLLYYFMSHPGEVFTSTRLLQDVWDYPSDTGSPDLVRMHIKNLRSKIEPNPSKPIYIKTIPRHGYTMPVRK